MTGKIVKSKNKSLQILFYCLSLTAVIALGTTLMQSAAARDEIQASAVTKMIPASFADLAETLSPAVVNISSTQKTTIPQDFPDMPQFPEGSPFKDFFEEFMERRGRGAPIPPASSLGSGFIIDSENGYIVTNNHVVRDAENVRVTFVDDVTVDAEIIGIDEKVDIAVLKVDTTDLKLSAVALGDSDKTRVGDWTLAIGNPFGLGGSVTAGIVSARARNINSGPYDDYIQTDASINRGNSGGPLFNMQGEVIGINTAIFSPTGGSVGIGFAIPSALAKPIIGQIIKYGRTRRGWLGVRIQSVTDEIAESFGLDRARGALVASVTEGGPAEEAGLKAGDIILELGQQDVQEMRFLPRLVAENDVGAKVELKYWRDEKEQKTTVTIGELEKAEEEGLIDSPVKSTGSGFEIPDVGLTVKPLDSTLRNQYSIAPTIEGLVIIKVEPDSPAFDKDLNEGNVIVEINQQPVTEPEDLKSIIEKAQKNGRKSVLLLVNDAGNPRFVPLSVNKRQ